MVVLSEHTKRKLRRLDKATRKLIGAEIRKYQNSEPVDIKKIKGEKDTWRIAVGSWRILIEASSDGEQELLTVADVVPRKDAYK